MSLATPKAFDARLRGFRMRYYVWEGRGPTMVMLHPSRGFARIWEFVVPYLAPEFRIVAPDQRGHGDSEKPAEGYAGEDFAADLEALLDHLGLPRVILVGHSLGGRTAQIFAGSHAGRVGKMVLVGGPHPESFGATPQHIRENREKVEAQKKMPQRFPDERAALEYLRTFWPELTDAMRQHIFACNMNRGPDGGVSFKYDCLKVAEGLSHMPDDLRGYARDITCPVLFLVRTRGINNLTPEGARDIAKCFEKTSVRIMVVEGSSFVQLENPAGVAGAIKEFVGSDLSFP